MSKITRVVVLVVGLMSVFAALAGAASASTWTNSGSTAFTATTGPGSLSVTGVATLSCTSGSATGTAPASTVSATYNVTGSLSYSSCRLGVITTSVSCSYTLVGNPPVTGGITSGNVTVNCREAVARCSITGTIPGQYRNASGSTPGQLSVDGRTGLTSSGCILSGRARLDPVPDVFTVSAGSPSAFGPILAVV
jgi:hypothetical protein